MFLFLKCGLIQRIHETVDALAIRLPWYRSIVLGIVLAPQTTYIFVNVATLRVANPIFELSLRYQTVLIFVNPIDYQPQPAFALLRREVIKLLGLIGAQEGFVIKLWIVLAAIKVLALQRVVLQWIVLQQHLLSGYARSSDKGYRCCCNSNK